MSRMYARISTFHGDPGRFAETNREIREFVVPGMRALAGFQGIVSLLDRETGTSMNLTFWDSRQALEDSEEETAMIRLRTTLPEDVRLVRVERYEVGELYIKERQD